MSARERKLKNSEDLSFFSIITKKYTEFVKKKLSAYNFTPNEVSTMIYLHEEKEIDTAKGISEKYGVTQSLICRSVDSLAKKGLVRVTSDPNDRRVNHLTLCVNDNTLLNILDNLNTEFMSDLFEGVSSDEEAEFRRILGQIARKVR